MTFDQATSVLREFGFPVFVALWFMIRLERRVDRLSDLLMSMMQAMTIIARSVEARDQGVGRTTGSVPALPDKEQA